MISWMGRQNRFNVMAAAGAMYSRRCVLSVGLHAVYYVTVAMAKEPSDNVHWEDEISGTMCQVQSLCTCSVFQ